MKASSSTDRSSADNPAALRPAPLSRKHLDAVPGVLGDICRRRRLDYAAPAAAATDRRADGGSFRTALLADGLSVIAEIKRASPSQGDIAPLDPVATAAAYRSGGARALSVLTEPVSFGGRLEHLSAVTAAVPLPALRKDFIVHPRQLDEAADAGAAAALLIVAVLGPHLGAYLAYARALGLAPLVEIHDEAELELALAAGADILGVNNRDLRSLDIDLATAPRLIAAARARGFTGVAVAESGYRDAGQLRPLLGVADAVLIGTSLAGSGDPGGALARLLRELGG